MMEIEEIIRGKVSVRGGGDICDEENNHIADARGWGRFKYMKNPDKIHDKLAEFISDAINEKLSKLKSK